MAPLIIALFMTAAAFFTVSLMHLLVWSRRPDFLVHLLFALTAMAAGGNAIAEALMYRATCVDAMSTALKWYVAMSGLWVLAFISFFSLYTRIDTVGRWLATGLSAVFLAAWVSNFFMPHSYLYLELSGMREITLPWGEQIRLAIGRDNPWRLAGELSMLGVFALVTIGCHSLWRQGQRSRSWLIGGSTAVFMLTFGTHAFLVDTGRLASPYLSSYGFLVVVLVVSYDLAGEVVRASMLSSQLMQKETELRTAVDEERNRIAGELHDSVTQTLFSTAVIADALPDVWDKYPDEARRGLEQLRQMTKGALAEMRTLLLELHPSVLLQKSLGELLCQLAEATKARTRIEVTAEIIGRCPLPDEVQVALYRVAQEALNNVIEHALAKSAKISLTCETRAVTLVISDDGQGFDPQAIDSRCLGLKIMRKRIRSIGAEVNFETKAGEGTAIRVDWHNGRAEESHD